MPKASLQDVGEPRILWTKKLVGLRLNQGIALSQGHIALSSGALLWIVDLDGDVTGQLLDPNTATGQAPVADKAGNFYFSTSSVYSVKPDGSLRWSLPLGPPSGAPQETTSTSRLLMSPEGILYFAASDGLIYAVRANDGRVVWKEAGALNSSGRLRGLSIGNGDTFYVDNIPYRVGTGMSSFQLLINGRPAWTMGTYSGQWAGFYDSVMNESRTRSFFVDTCGHTLWSFPNQADSSWEVSLIGYNEAMLVHGDSHGSNTYIYDVRGKMLRGPSSMRGRVQCLGADSAIYNLESWTSSGKAFMTLVSYSWDLKELWSLDLGEGYTNGGVVLADNGALYFARQLTDGIELVAVQTQSPGLADTAMPTWLYNNRRTGWLE